MLEELGVPFHNEVCMPRDKVARKYSPLGKVPAMVDGDFVMFESAAINTYLGDKFRGAGPELVPAPGTLERARYEQWVSFIMTEVDAQGLWIHRKHEALPKVFPHFPAIPDAVSFARAQYGAAVHVLVEDMRRRGSPFVLGATFSAVDILFAHCLTWGKEIGWLPMADAASGDIPPGLTGADLELLHSYLKTCTARDGFKRAWTKYLAPAMGGTGKPKSKL